MNLEDIKKIVTPILQSYRITKAGVFGSFAKKKDHENSDIDILVELGDSISLLDFVKIKLELESQLNRKVDLVEYVAVKPQIKERIFSEEIRIYG